MTPAEPNQPNAHEQAGDDLAELALGVLAGERRTAVLTHVEHCAACRHELLELTHALDGVLLATPASQPPPGFEKRVLAAVTPERARLRTALPAVPARRVAIAAALVVLAGAAAAGTAIAVGDSAPTAPSTARAAALRAGGAVRGEVVVTTGATPLLMMSLGSGSWPAWVTCEVLTGSGRPLDVGRWAPSAGAAWSTRLGINASAVVGTRLIADDGTVLATARFTH